ncbi:hypothetical protein OGAPHI_005145 [Ogataea philodendri]|uniref:Mitochondrial outer membrane transport complex Sam37/metaxin N-terminal domain-containing protein n=1 Tax=Ogataea philodendri TaxID=1378263 RepID=A0A9P8P0S8_9ASCO|nr:uncharacterized protein OGAPHI_005145 [Ogataea philodendri]KAH3663743.1 hypothetical protein OGAPHI_005145 [Ogataea philodendri]
MSIHLWGGTFDAESIAIAQFLAAHGGHIDIQLNYDSNYLLSPNGKLPLLKDGSLLLQGYKEIVDHLSTKFHLFEYSTETNLLDQGLIEHLLKSMDIVTSYNYFLNKVNYDNYTRGVFKQLLPFPFQYKPPLNLKSAALATCETAGISSSEDSDQLLQLKERQKSLLETPVLSNFDKSKRDASLKQVLYEMDILTNMRCITMLEDTIKLVTDLQLPQDSSSMILFQAYILSNTSPNLKADFVAQYLQRNHPNLVPSQPFTDQIPDIVSFTQACRSLAQNYL